MTLVEDEVYLPVIARKFKIPEDTIDSLSLPKAVKSFSLFLYVYIIELKYIGTYSYLLIRGDQQP